MHRLELNEVDQRIAKACDPARKARYVVVYHNPDTQEQWLVARVLPAEVKRFKEALTQQGCEIVIANLEQGAWNSLEWLRVDRKAVTP